MASILTSAGFAAPPVLRFATAATVGAVALPEMKAKGYDRRLAAGAVAAGGVLGVLIPFRLLIFYAALTEVSAGKMLIAGFVPGIITTIAFMLGVALIGRRVQDHSTRAHGQHGATGYRPRHRRGRFWCFSQLFSGDLPWLVTPTEAGRSGHLRLS
ncbi:TRAP transporter large permease subunit [Celeribacter baekdonensis]|uniref:TRAP transporter large permease subunit n=1 Tax=Celeribacter baekdonensis TaxID=875171 RepID=UPI0020C7869F|nr:TRAP transporter large permease subunit [Celeribacter baekdonensis]